MINQYTKFYNKFSESRIKFTKKYINFYKFISYEINKFIDKSSNLLLLSAGHSIMVDMLNFKSAFVSEINENFHRLYKKKNVEQIKDLKKIKKNNVSDVIISNLEYSTDPIQLLDDVNKILNPNGKVLIVCNNIIWNPFLKLFENLGLKFKHPRRNAVTFKFIKNLCFITDYELVQKKKVILSPFYIPVLTFVFNEVFAKLPIISSFCFVSIYVIRSKIKKYPKIENLKVSIIVPCKNEEKNIKLVAESLSKIGRETEVLFGDDKSNDNTKIEILKYIKKKKNLTIKYYEGPGICKADNVYKGFDLATGDILVIHDADNTVDPSEIPKLIEVLINKNQNLIIGSRLIYPMENRAMKLSNYLGNIFFSKLYSIILKQSISDTLCGTKIIFKKDWVKIKRFCGTWGVKDKWGDFDLLSGARMNNMKIAEVPVNYRERTEGESKMTNTIFNGIRMFIICFYSLLKIRFN